ncbi:hypothetical protein D7B24_008583 [Verticillium nonalfalfae]|uniref:Ubiquitin carboxyl-terminal hydrolase 19 n=1 Tax=Verticillium nonalfalfae TaxID=1051616 RepID=A0A3M9Y4A5_9PEZI|nr:uncharacterized protein D7B24_008583 [Verticillium nonalfalfae]RNJ55359.1 hypothetical protein D7B24_008583 [Verticillium nonalfalfae]
MDSRFAPPRDELYTLQMDLKQVQLVQNSQAERLARLERRQEQDANLKSVWQQHPFPGVLAGTPQQGPTHVSAHDLYDMDEPDNLLNSLHLGPAEEEPARRGAASRANSVRFDESALRQSDWASHSARHSGEFGPPRPSSGMLMERSLSHKSDGRHSSAGHSVHSVHSLASGRASSLGMHTDNFLVSSHEDDSPIDAVEPPPEFFILGSVPSIIRCWLSTNFAHATMRYADLCTGSQKSVIDYSLIRELELEDELERDVDGVYKIRMNVYLVEATPERTRRSVSPGQIPSITAVFEVTGMDQGDGSEARKGIQIFIGSDTLRAHMADILFSQNRMSLVGNGREKLSVPFVRPEDDGCFKRIYTTNVLPERPRLNANARPFVSFEPRAQVAPPREYEDELESCDRDGDEVSRGLPSPMMDDLETAKSVGTSTGALSESGGDGELQAKELSGSVSVTGSTDGGRRGSSGGIWGSWRHGPATGGGGGGGGGGADNGQRDGGPLSGYQPAGRGTRNMKVLKPLKSGGSSSSARTGAAYEPAPPRRTSGEQRRKGGQPTNSGASDSGSSNGLRWEPRRAASTSGVVQTQPREARSTTVTSTTSVASQPHVHVHAPAQAHAHSSSTPLATPMPRSANPIGGASAFSWMNPAGKAKPTATAE